MFRTIKDYLGNLCHVFHKDQLGTSVRDKIDYEAAR